MEDRLEITALCRSEDFEARDAQIGAGRGRGIYLTIIDAFPSPYQLREEVDSVSLKMPTICNKRNKKERYS